MPETIQRYTMAFVDGGHEEMFDDDEGDWVAYDDHLASQQKLVDACFEIAAHSAKYGNIVGTHYDHEGHMDWVANQLRLLGFDTQPQGMSWGVLKENPPISK